MSILKSLEAIIDVSSLRKGEFSEENIIRLEKKLKAQMNIEGDVDINQIESIIALLRKNSENLTKLYQHNYRHLREILKRPNYCKVFKKIGIVCDPNDHNFISFLEKEFTVDLKVYIDNCFKEDHYNALNSIMSFADVLPQEILEHARSKAYQKLEFGYEYVKLHEAGLDKKASYLLNPFYFRFISHLGAVYFESKLSDVYNLIIEKMQRKKDFMRFLLASGNYSAMGSDFQKVLSENRALAYKKGAREYKNDDFADSHKGDTFMTTAFSSSGSGSSGDDSSLKGCFGALGGVGFVVIIILKIALFSSRNSNSNHDYSSNIYEMNSKLEETLNKIKNGEQDESFYEYQFDTDSLVFKDIEFDIENTDFKSYNNSGIGPEKKCDIVNLTSKPVIVSHMIFLERYFVFLQPGESKAIMKSIDDIIVYTGESPQVAEYYDFEDFRDKKAFRFDKFTEQDSITLYKDFKLDPMIEWLSYKIEILETTEEVEVEVIRE